MSVAPSFGRVDPAKMALLKERLKDRMWRLCSGKLYKIAPADGSGIIPFIPSPEQRKIFKALLGGCKRLALPKCRRPGFSTALGIFALDMMLFVGGVQISLVDQNQQDASKKLDRIVGVAFDNLPGWLRKRVKEHARSGKHVCWQLRNKPKSDFYAGMNARGGSNDLLWVSEWAVIQYEDPKRSSKIRSGGLPSARHGIAVIESTWAGGKCGDVYELLAPVLEGKSNDWEILFSPWWKDARNVDATAKIDDVARTYFKEVDPRLLAMGVILSDEQKRWWAKEKREQGIFMARENPTFMEEMWTSPVPGAIYAAAIDRARGEGRIGKMPVDPSSLVHTLWDLGAPLQTVVWYFQIVGRYIRFIDCDRKLNLTIFERAAHMMGKGYLLGNHFMPHDARSKEGSGYSLADEFAAAMLKLQREQVTKLDHTRANLKFVPRTHDVWVGINKVLQLFPLFEFREPICEDAVSALAMYRMKEEGEGALQSKVPVHDDASHTADPIRVLGEAMIAGLVSFKHTLGDGRRELNGERRAKRGVKSVNVGG